MADVLKLGARGDISTGCEMVSRPSLAGHTFKFKLGPWKFQFAFPSLFFHVRVALILE
jgi:hypothetical protein